MYRPLTPMISYDFHVQGTFTPLAHTHAGHTQINPPDAVKLPADFEVS